MPRYKIEVRFVGDQDEMDWLEEAIEQAGGNVISIEED